MQLPWWWPGPFLLQMRSLAWGEQQSISKVSQQGGCRDQRGAPELGVRPLGPQPCPAMGGTVALCWRKLEVLPPAPLTRKDLGKSAFSPGPQGSEAPPAPNPRGVTWGSDQTGCLGGPPCKFQTKAVQASPRGRLVPWATQTECGDRPLPLVEAAKQGRTQRAGCKHLFPREMGVAGKLECSLLLSKRTRSSRPRMSRQASYWCDTHLWPPRKTACKYHPRSRPFTRGPGTGLRVHLPRNVLRAGTGCGANDLVSFAEICRMWTELTFLPWAERKELLTEMSLFQVSPPSRAGGRLGPPRETPAGVGKISPYRRCEHKCPGLAWLQPPALVHPLAAVRKGIQRLLQTSDCHGVQQPLCPPKGHRDNTLMSPSYAAGPLLTDFIL